MHLTPPRKRHFIGVALAGKHKEAVDALRESIAKAFGVKGALTSPPHITLFYPFETEGSERLKDGLRRLAASTAPFTVPVTGFKAFGEEVWFLEPTQARELFQLKETVAAVVKDSIDIAERVSRRETHFHVTLAYKDVAPEIHRRIAEFLSHEPIPISNIVVDAIVLFGRRPDDKGWEPAEIFTLKGI